MVLICLKYKFMAYWNKKFKTNSENDTICFLSFWFFNDIMLRYKQKVYSRVLSSFFSSYIRAEQHIEINYLPMNR